MYMNLLKLMNDYGMFSVLTFILDAIITNFTKEICHGFKIASFEATP